jgi:hypothetical protein
VAKTVIGLIDNLGQAQAAVRELVESGIARHDIGFMANQRHELPGTAQLNESEGAGALAGAGTGAALGGMAGLALALAPLAIPGIGPILAAGPIAAALAGAGLGALAGGLIGGLTSLGVPEEEAHYYAEALRRGGILVTVAVDKTAQANLAVAILRRHGAVDIDQRATEWKKQGWKGRFDAADQPGAATQRPAVQEPHPVVRAEEAAYGARTYPKPAKRARKKAQKRAAYTGPERRVNSTPWPGEERRKAA